MKEDFLHYIWKQKQFKTTGLQTTNNEALAVKAVGSHNHLSGPDFFNAQIHIDGQLWAGNVEIHVKSSDWYVHNHETDQAYDNVILHVVWEHDAQIFRKDKTVIPTLEIKDFVEQPLLANYNKLLANNSLWINCEKDFATIDDFVMNHWLERLYFERLEQKSNVIYSLLEQSQNNWEAVLFAMLAKNFGLNINGEAFLSMAQSFDFKIVRKLQNQEQELEALFLGQSGLLDVSFEDAYANDLTKRHAYLKQKFNLDNKSVLPVQFFRLRPNNFPTIRLAQLASLYHTQHALFSKLMATNNLKDFYELFKISVSAYWETHYNFSSVSKKTKKQLTKPFVHLLLINTIVPLQFAYAKSQGKDNMEMLLKLMQQLPLERNSIVTKFQELRPLAQSAFQSQALIQLKKTYCNVNKCLQCAVGNTLLNE